MYDSPEGYINDETFTAWFYRMDEKHIVFWEDYISAHPEHQAHITSAIAFLRGMDLKEASAGNTQAALHKLRHNISATEGSVVAISRRRWYYGAAAAAVLLIAAFGLMRLQSPQKIQYATGNGETRNISLPDGSVVMLNANSSLEVAKAWEKGDSRVVWLKGEAFFTVTANPSADRFLVHADNMHIEVLGTEFNVKQRRSHTTVVLQSGKVKLSAEKTAPLIMKPGELVTYGKTTGRFSQKTVNTNTYTAWKQGQMIFENASIREIADILEEHFGVEVRLEGEALSQTAFNGMFPANDMHILLQALSKAYQLEIEQQNNTIIIRDKER